MLPPRHIKGGRVRAKDLPRGPEGRAQCRQCSTEVPKGRRTFCSQACVDRWVIRTGSGMERFLRKRDKGICALCGLDCVALKREFKKLLLKADKDAFRVRHGIPKHRSRRFWDIDHIVPVIEGGGDCGPENLRTLCLKHHKEETSKLRKRLADKAKLNKPCITK